MKISVVVGTWNRKMQLQTCVESIFNQTRTAVRVYVTDAGSTDGTIEYLESIASNELVPIFVGRRIGQAKAYNDVFRQIETPYVCWLSDDNVIVNRGLDVVVKILDENRGIGMVALKVKDVTGPFVDAPYIGGVSTIGVLNVNQGMLRTSILKDLGGFSESFTDYGIDPDLAARVILSSYVVAYTRQIAIHHYRNWTSDRSSEEFARQMQKQKTYFELYDRKYRTFMTRAVGWRVKRFAWHVLRRALRVSMTSTRPFLGLIARDWHNIFSSRYISLFDPLRCRGQPYYLVQQCPRTVLPGSLPRPCEDFVHPIVQ